MNLKTAKKGQTYAIDAIAAVIIFSVVLVFLVAFWYNTISNANSLIVKSRMQAEALSASDALLGGPGNPFNWEYNASTVKALGLATSKGVLSRQKLSNFTAMPYDSAKAALGFTYDFYLYVEDVNGTRLYSIGNQSFSAQHAVSITRFGVIGERKVRLRLVTYG